MSEGIIPNEPESYRPPTELYPYLTNVGEIYEGEMIGFNSSKNHHTTECLTFSHFSDHRWTFHTERVHPADFENSPVNHLIELQSVSPQQLVQPYRFSSESLPLHLDPPLVPLSVSPQVSSCVEMRGNYCEKTKSLHM